MIAREQVCYRVLHTRPSYMTDVDETFDPAANLIKSDFVDIEFDTFEFIGHWLFLGTEIQSLRIPTDAKVELNGPMGQGDCYSYSADRLEVLETRRVADWLGDLGEVYEGSLHIKDIALPANFCFPKCRSIHLEDMELDTANRFAPGTSRVPTIRRALMGIPARKIKL